MSSQKSSKGSSADLVDFAVGDTLVFRYANGKEVYGKVHLIGEETFILALLQEATGLRLLEPKRAVSIRQGKIVEVNGFEV